MIKGFDLGPILTGEYAALMLQGALLTLKLMFFAWLLAMSLAFLLVVVRLTHNKLAEHLVAQGVTVNGRVTA